MKKKVEGMVVARRCICCGHYELGIESKDGEYVRLQEGMMVRVIEK